MQVTGLSNVVSVAAGDNYTFAVKSDGTVWAWGWNAYGQLGDGTTYQRVTPVQVSGLRGVVAVTAGTYSTFALKNDGTVWGWGNNSYGQLGNGSGTSSVPVRSGMIYDVVAIAAGQMYGEALKADGTVWGWGDNGYGQLGNGTTSGATVVPTQAIGVSNAIAIATGQKHTVVLRADGTVMTCGSNTNGQLGDRTTSMSNPSTCLQGNFRLGHEHLKAGPDRSTCVW